MTLAGKKPPSIFDEAARLRRAEQAEHARRNGGPKPYEPAAAGDTPCPTCDLRAWADSVCCPYCGGRMPSLGHWKQDPRDVVVCPSCLEKNSTLASFCDQCGARTCRRQRSLPLMTPGWRRSAALDGSQDSRHGGPRAPSAARQWVSRGCGNPSRARSAPRAGTTPITALAAGRSTPPHWQQRAGTRSPLARDDGQCRRPSGTPTWPSGTPRSTSSRGGPT